MMITIRPASKLPPPLTAAGVEENDPVMGGVSTNCTFDVDAVRHFAVFQGKVCNVFLSSCVRRRVSLSYLRS